MAGAPDPGRRAKQKQRTSGADRTYDSRGPAAPERAETKGRVNPMRRPAITLAAVCGGLLCLALVAPAEAGRGLAVEVWTDRGNDAVYNTGDPVQVSVRTSDDAHLLVYEIDSEGYVRLLFPYRGSGGFVEGRQTYEVPPEQANLELVAEGATGQGYIVAVASRDPFRTLPWYLRPYDLQAEDIGYTEEGAEDEGVTREGRIVGDPFVAMERIRRAVVEQPNDGEDFASAYASYYIGERVRYPRYLCYDCHRPNHWAWWDGFDPYYTTCSAFSFRVNWNWFWGPSYWNGYVPYYVYIYLPTCPPRYHVGDAVWYSSWDGWTRWRALWGGPLVRYKSPPPVGYVPPDKYREAAPGRTPPGYLGGAGFRGGTQPAPVGRYRDVGIRVRDGATGAWRGGERAPMREPQRGRASSGDDRGGRRGDAAPNRGGFERGQARPDPPANRGGEQRFERPARPDPPARREEPRVEPQRRDGNNSQRPPARVDPPQRKDGNDSQPPPARVDPPQRNTGQGRGEDSGNRFRR